MSRITEKRIYRVDPVALTSDGTIDGKLSIADSSIFMVGQIVMLDSDTQQPLEVKINRILPDMTTIYVGPPAQHISKRADISAFLIADNATIFANEQPRPSIPEQEIERNTYEEEPTIARRTILVDKWGCRVDDSNPLPISGSISLDLPFGATPLIYNVNAIIVDTEYSQLLPSTTLQFSIRARNNARLQFAFTSGDTNSNFLTVVPGNIYYVKDLELVSTTLYFQANKPNTVVEIMAWI